MVIRGLVLALAALLASIAPKTHAAGIRGYVIGDSLTVGAVPYFQADGYVPYGIVGRQFSGGLPLAAYLGIHGFVRGKNVIVELGTNGPITRDDMARMLGDLRTARRIVFVTNHAMRPWIAGNNALLESVRRNHPHRVRLARWNRVATLHPQWFGPDGIHPDAGGSATLVSLAVRAAQ